MQDQLRHLPKVQTLLETDIAAQLIQAHGHEDVAQAIRARIDQARTRIRANGAEQIKPVSAQDILVAVSADLAHAQEPTLRTAINATGIIIHTNLGRARLAPEAIAAMQRVASAYSTLELDQASGKRGSRQDHVERLICKLTGAEAALVVNNCAAAILVSLCALGSGREIVASRGEMVEIGGSFRMPDVIAQSGARLVEVGTTNKTHLKDYKNAITEETALLLKSHTSNYKIIGFTAAPSRQDLSMLAKDNEIVLVEDLGSGVLIDLAAYGLTKEPVVSDVLEAGVDLVTFSGDKLLGGPQAGLIAGHKALIDQIKQHPMARAMRIDKLSLAALIETLKLYRAPNDPTARIPTLQMLSEPAASIRDRAARLLTLIDQRGDLTCELAQTAARAGAGSLPEQDLPSFAVTLQSSVHSANAIAASLRAYETPIIARISKDVVVLDMRAVAEDDLDLIADAINHQLAS
jgi:L-seryl-tRNA(Ser) seleniumtransferase